MFSPTDSEGRSNNSVYNVDETTLSNYDPTLKKFHNPTDTDMYKAAWHT